MANPLTADDRFAIQDLFAKYAWSFATGDAEGFISCFTPDALLVEEVFEDPDVWEGHAGLRAFTNHYFNVPNFPGRQHHVTQTQLEGDATEVKSRSYAFVTECQGEPPYVLRFAGYYVDHMVKRDGAWLFADRRIRLWDGPILASFPGKGDFVPRKRPPELKVKRNGETRTENVR